MHAFFAQAGLPYNTKFWREKTLAKWLTAIIGGPKSSRKSKASKINEVSALTEQKACLTSDFTA